MRLPVQHPDLSQIHFMDRILFFFFFADGSRGWQLQQFDRLGSWPHSNLPEGRSWTKWGSLLPGGKAAKFPPCCDIPGDHKC